MSKNIIIAHGGKIGIRPSLPSQTGTTFFIDIPVSTEPHPIINSPSSGVDQTDNRNHNGDKYLGDPQVVRQSSGERGVRRSNRFGLSFDFRSIRDFGVPWRLSSEN